MIVASYLAYLALLAGFVAYSDSAGGRREAKTSPLRPDIGPDLYPTDRACMWDFQRVEVGNKSGCFVVAIGPWYDQDQWRGYRDPRPPRPAFYRVKIYPYVCGNYWRMNRGGPPPCFQRDFKPDELPAGLHEKSIKEVMSFDAATGIVTFHIGERQVTYTLP